MSTAEIRAIMLPGVVFYVDGRVVARTYRGSEPRPADLVRIETLVDGWLRYRVHVVRRWLGDVGQARGATVETSLSEPGEIHVHLIALEPAGPPLAGVMAPSVVYLDGTDVLTRSSRGSESWPGEEVMLEGRTGLRRFHTHQVERCYGQPAVGEGGVLIVESEQIMIHLVQIAVD